MNTFFATLKKRAFATLTDAALSIIVFGGLGYALWLTLDWAVFRAVWSKENVEACGEGVGACWSVIDARHRLILFGLYPYEEHWRSTLACLAIVATVVISCFPWSWKISRLAMLWFAGFATFYLLIKGTLLGLPTVTTDQWGGLVLILFLFASVVLIGMPMGFGLALMRRSEMPFGRLLASLLIDFIRSWLFIFSLGQYGEYLGKRMGVVQR